MMIESTYQAFYAKQSDDTIMQLYMDADLLHFFSHSISRYTYDQYHNIIYVLQLDVIEIANHISIVKSMENYRF